MERIDLVVWDYEGEEIVSWPYGKVLKVSRTIVDAKNTIDKSIAESESDFLLFWDAALGAPDEGKIQAVASLPGDLWHAGLKLGMAGKPEAIDFIQPTWMLNNDASPEIVSTSWRISLRACLVKTSVLKQLGFIDPKFETLSAAGLDWGLRLVSAGVIPRNVPDLVENPVTPVNEIIPLIDEFRIIRTWTNKFWLGWSLIFTILTGYCALSEAVSVWENLRVAASGSVGIQYHRIFPQLGDKPLDLPPVSVLIPTIQRYPYLKTLLDQLRDQTIAPLEIIVLDQTPSDERDANLASEFEDLPLKLIVLDQPGQCTSRNLGVAQARGDYILFLDDDVEVERDTIEMHWFALSHFKADVSVGSVHEPPEEGQVGKVPKIQISSIFPAGNSMIRKEIFKKSGLFDLAYDHGSRADGDLGMRLYLSGALMIQNLANDILHHHAPRGGLRTHSARVVTAAQSKRSIFKRNLPSVSDFYLASRYFSPSQVFRFKVIMIMASLRPGGGGVKGLAKSVTGFFLLPATIFQINSRHRKAKELFDKFPQIPSLDEGIKLE